MVINEYFICYFLYEFFFTIINFYCLVLLNYLMLLYSFFPLLYSLYQLKFVPFYQHTFPFYLYYSLFALIGLERHSSFLLVNLSHLKPHKYETDFYTLSIFLPYDSMLYQSQVEVFLKFLLNNLTHLPLISPL